MRSGLHPGCLRTAAATAGASPAAATARSAGPHPPPKEACHCSCGGANHGEGAEPFDWRACVNCGAPILAIDWITDPEGGGTFRFPHYEPTCDCPNVAIRAGSDEED